MLARSRTGMLAPAFSPVQPTSHALPGRRPTTKSAGSRNNCQISSKAVSSGEIWPTGSEQPQTVRQVLPDRLILLHLNCSDPPARVAGVPIPVQCAILSASSVCSSALPLSPCQRTFPSTRPHGPVRTPHNRTNLSQVASILAPGDQIIRSPSAHGHVPSVAWLTSNHHRPIMTEAEKLLVARAIARAPQWVRHDLCAKDAAVRVRAEETLVALIINGLEKGTAESAEG